MKIFPRVFFRRLKKEKEKNAHAHINTNAHADRVGKNERKKHSKQNPIT